MPSRTTTRRSGPAFLAAGVFCLLGILAQAGSGQSGSIGRGGGIGGSALGSAIAARVGGVGQPKIAGKAAFAQVEAALLHVADEPARLSLLPAGSLTLDLGGSYTVYLYNVAHEGYWPLGYDPEFLEPSAFRITNAQDTEGDIYWTINSGDTSVSYYTHQNVATPDLVTVWRAWGSEEPAEGVSVTVNTNVIEIGGQVIQDDNETTYQYNGPSAAFGGWEVDHNIFATDGLTIFPYVPTGTNDGKVSYNRIGYTGDQWRMLFISGRWLCYGNSALVELIKSFDDVATPNLAANWLDTDNNNVGTPNFTQFTLGDFRSGLWMLDLNYHIQFTMVVAPGSATDFHNAYQEVSGGGAEIHADINRNQWRGEASGDTALTLWPWQSTYIGDGHVIIQNPIAAPDNWEEVTP